MSHWILLRGLTREQRHWGEFPERFRATFSDYDATGVVCIDLPGNGCEANVRSPENVREMTAWLRDKALGLNLQPPYRLLAMSLGGMVATDWAQRHPEEIDALVLINTSMRPFCAVTERLRPSAWPNLARVAASWTERMRCEGLIHELTCNRVDTLSDDLIQWRAIRAGAPVSARNALRQLWAAARFTADAAPPRCPALLLSSQADALVDPRCSTRVAARWQAAHATHPWAGHDLPHDDPQWTADAILAWQRARVG